VSACFIVGDAYSISTAAQKKIPNAPREKGCEDLLSALHRKPYYIQFLDCKQRTDLQGAPLEAKYRTEGSRAAKAEDYLHKEFKIKRLRRTCCVWESADNSYRDAHKRLYAISMSSEETTIDQRDRWWRIDYFYITVDFFRDEP
jgi:hypothetical protein